MSLRINSVHEIFEERLSGWQSSAIHKLGKIQLSDKTPPSTRPTSQSLNYPQEGITSIPSEMFVLELMTMMATPMLAETCFRLAVQFTGEKASPGDTEMQPLKKLEMVEIHSSTQSTARFERQGRALSKVKVTRIGRAFAERNR